MMSDMSQFCAECERLAGELEQAREKARKWARMYQASQGELAEVEALRAEVARLKSWFSDNAALLAVHNIGGYCILDRGTDVSR